MQPPDPPILPKEPSLHMTQTLTPSILPTDTATGLQVRLQTLIWKTLNPVKPSPLMTPPLSTSWIPIPPLTLSLKPTSIMCLNTNLPIMGLLLTGEPMVALLAQM